MATHWDNIFLAPGLGQAAFAAAWTPASSTTDGVVSVHTWHNPAVAQFQDSALTTPAVSDGDPVGGSTSQGTDAHSIIQAVTAAKPTLKLNILNGHPVWRLDGGDWLRAAFVGGLISQPYTIFTVAQLSAIAIEDGAYDTLIESNSATRVIVRNDYVPTPDKWQIASTSAFSGPNTDSNWNIWTVLFNGASSQAWFNGVSGGSGNAGANGMGGLTLGANYLGAGGWVGDMAEILIYPGNLSLADKNQVAQYLATKFGRSYTDIT